MSQGYRPIEDFDFFRDAESVARQVWDLVLSWPPFARDTLGKQLVRSTDSIGANLAEGDGRSGSKDAIHFFVIARASSREARLHLRRAGERGLIDGATCEELLSSLESVARRLSLFIRSRVSRAGLVREEVVLYDPEPEVV